MRALPEVRVQIGATRFRVPDLCLIPLDRKRTPVLTEAPLLCIEILSPEDRFGRMRARCEDYLRMGVPEVWILDPAARTLTRLHPDGSTTLSREGTVRLAGTSAEVDLQKLFSTLDV